MAYVRRKRSSVARRRRNRFRKKTWKRNRQLVTKAGLYRALSRNQETKSVSSYLTAQINTTTTSSDFIQLLGPLTNGLYSHQRVGSKIKPIRMVVDYVVYISTDYADSLQPAYSFSIRPIIFKFREYSCYETTTIGTDQLYLFDWNGPSAWTGSILDPMKPVNNNLVVPYYDRLFKLTKAYGYTNVNETGSYARYTVEPSKHIRRGKFVFTRKHLPAILRYDDETTTSESYPVNFAPYMIFNMTDNNEITHSTNIVTYCVACKLYYKDA